MFVCRCPIHPQKTPPYTTLQPTPCSITDRQHRKDDEKVEEILQEDVPHQPHSITNLPASPPAATSPTEKLPFDYHQFTNTMQNKPLSHSIEEAIPQTQSHIDHKYDLLVVSTHLGPHYLKYRKQLKAERCGAFEVQIAYLHPQVQFQDFIGILCLYHDEYLKFN